MIIEKLLEGIEIRLNIDYFANRSELDSLADKIVYTGPIDRYLHIVMGSYST